MLPDAPHPGSKLSQVPKSCPEGDQGTYHPATAPYTRPQANGPQAARGMASETSRPQNSAFQPHRPAWCQRRPSLNRRRRWSAVGSRDGCGQVLGPQIRALGLSLPPPLTGRPGSWETPGQVRARTQARHTPGSACWKDQALCLRPQKWTDNR